MGKNKKDVLEDKDLALRDSNPFYEDLPPLEPCVCGGIPIIDSSMGLIYCEKCGLSFEYRYNKGLVPYHTWQAYHGK
ncbi:MAG: hypothetical protein JEZ11_27585 [Desulfobacterales bacterium]|nr:hypothetical protein [Desulfobacterales bacterium]